MVFALVFCKIFIRTNKTFMKKTFTLNQKNSKNQLITENNMNDLQSVPSDRVLQNIFNYSSALSVLKTVYTGNCNLILN